MFFHLLPLFLLSISQVSAAVDTVDIYGIAQCGRTTNVVRYALRSLLAEFKAIPKNLNISYHPQPFYRPVVNGTQVPVCNGGQDECDLEKFQVCSKKYIISKNNTEMLAAMMCAQGQKNLASIMPCVPKGNVGQQIMKCAKSSEGDKLLLQVPGPKSGFKSMPHIEINGKYSKEAATNFKAVVCALPSAKNEKACKPK